MISHSCPSTAAPISSTAQLEQLSNEDLYEALTANTSLLDEGLEMFVQRLRPIIINASRGYLSILSWDYSDALQEARILI